MKKYFQHVFVSPFLFLLLFLALPSLASAADTTPPTVSLTAPTSGATVSGASVTVSATASDDVGVVGVQFKLDGANLGAEDTTSPYSATWNSTTATNGAHTLTATARDAAGNTTTTVNLDVNRIVAVATGMQSLTAAQMDFAQQSGAKAARFDISWYGVEGTQGTRNWSQPDNIVNGLVARGITPHAVIFKTPVWARPASCTANISLCWPDPC